MLWTRRKSEPLFLVCVEASQPDRAPAPGLARVLKTWGAERCLSNSWTIGAATTSRVIYDSFAGAIEDGDRLLVCELDGEALWYNIQ